MSSTMWQRKPQPAGPPIEAFQNTLGIAVLTPGGALIAEGHWYIPMGSPAVLSDAEFRRDYQPASRKGCPGCGWGDWRSMDCPKCRTEMGLMPL